MKSKGISKLFIAISAGIFSLALTGFFNPSSCQAFDISINVSPNIINLQSIDHTFGVHTSIAYADVNTDSVKLVCDGADLIPTVCYADSNGRLVAKFLTADLDYCELEIGSDNTFTLTGTTKGIDPPPVEEFSGEDSVLIIENQAELQKGSGPKTVQKKLGQNR